MRPSTSSSACSTHSRVAASSTTVSGRVSLPTSMPPAKGVIICLAPSSSLGTSQSSLTPQSRRSCVTAETHRCGQTM